MLGSLTPRSLAGLGVLTLTAGMLSAAAVPALAATRGVHAVPRQTAQPMPAPLAAMLAAHARHSAPAVARRPGSVQAVQPASGGYMVTAAIAVGANPYSVAVNAGPHTAYVANYSAGTVSVIDGSTNLVTATVTTEGHPYAVAVNPGSNNVYVTDPSAGIVTVIDGATNVVTATVSVGVDVNAVAVNPSTNTVYVTNPSAGIVTVIDGGTNTVTTTIPIGGNPYAVAVNPSTNTVYATSNAGNGTVAVIDGATNTVTTTVPVGGYLGGLASNPTTNTVYVTNTDNGTVTVIDGATNTVTTTVPVNSYFFFGGLGGVAVDPSTGKVYIANGGNAVTILDGGTNTVTASLSVGSNPTGAAVDPVSHTAYISNSAGGTVSLIKPAAGPRVRPTPLVGATLGAVATAPDQRSLFDQTTGWNLEQTSQSGPYWTDAGRLGGTLRSGPAAATLGGVDVEVFAVGADNALWEKDFANDSAPGSWSSRSGTLTGAPAAAGSTFTGGSEMSTARMDVVARGGDGALWQKTMLDGVAQAWSSLGGRFLPGSNPVIGWTGENQLTVAGVGTDGAAWTKRFTAGHWSSWSSLGGKVSGLGLAADHTTGVVQLFGQGGNRALFAKTLRGGSWSAWSSLGGLLSSPPAATTFPSSGRTDVFAVGGDQRLWQRTLTGSTWGSWTLLP